MPRVACGPEECGWWDELDPGVKPYVHALREQGVQTIESCDGGPGHSYPEPTIAFSGPDGEGWRALSMAIFLQMPVRSLRRSWRMEGGKPIGPEWELTFYLPSSLSAAQ